MFFNFIIFNFLILLNVYINNLKYCFSINFYIKIALSLFLYYLIYSKLIPTKERIRFKWQYGYCSEREKKKEKAKEIYRASSVEKILVRFVP